MKWFQHETDAHSHPKWKQIIKEFGPVGYYVGFVTLEIIGKYGDKYLRLSLEKYPKTDLADALGVKADVVEKVWARMVDKKLLSRNHLKNNILYSPKLKERADEYTKRRGTLSGQYRDNIRLQYNTLQEITRHYITRKGWMDLAEKNKDLMNDLFRRNVKSAKQLVVLAGGLQDAKDAMDWLAGAFNKKGLSWTIETILRWYPEYLKTGKKSAALKALEERVS